MTMEKSPEYGFQGISRLDQIMQQRSAAVDAAFLLPYLERGMSIIDAGCGQGTITVGLAEAVNPGAVLGFDPQETHLEHGRAMAGKAGVTNVIFAVGSVYEPPSEAESFDVAFAHVVFSHLDKPEVALQSMFKVLKPGGLIAIRDRGAPAVTTGQGADAALRDFRVLGDTATKVGGSPYGTHIGEHLNRLCREAGFIDIVATASWSVNAATSFGHPLVEPLARRAIEIGVISEQDYRDVMKTIESEWLTDPDALLAVPFFEVVARKP